MLVLPLSLSVQADNHLPRVYLDVPFWPTDYITSEADFVDYVRDRDNADIHVLGIRQRTGGAGSEVTLTFYGLNHFTGQNDTLSYHIYANENGETERTRGLATLKRGLLPYVLQTQGAADLHIDIHRPDRVETLAADIVDPWNGWVFRIGGKINTAGEESKSRLNTRDFLNAKWIGEDWKFEFSAHGEYDRRRDQLTDDRGTESIEDDSSYFDVSIGSEYGFQFKIGWGLSDHWSLGAYTGVEGHSVQNIHSSYWFNPAIEYNFFPYSESTRRQFRIGARLKPNYREYIEETIYDKQEELLWSSELRMDVEMMEPWGSIDAGVRLSSYLHDFSKNSAQLWGRSSLKVWKGLSVDTHASIALLRNELNISKAGRDLADIYLERKAVETNYRYSMHVGLTYTFGSIYRAVINERFGYW